MLERRRRLRLVASGAALVGGYVLLLADSPPPQPPCETWEPYRAAFTYETNCLGGGRGQFEVVRYTREEIYQSQATAGPFVVRADAIVDNSACHNGSGIGRLAGFKVVLYLPVGDGAAEADCGELSEVPDGLRTLSCTVRRWTSPGDCTIQIAPAPPEPLDAAVAD